MTLRQELTEFTLALAAILGATVRALKLPINFDAWVGVLVFSSMVLGCLWPRILGRGLRW